LISSDFSLMKTLGGTACPLLPLSFPVQALRCVCFCVHVFGLFLRARICAAVCLCILLKSSPLSVMDDTDLHSDRQEGRQPVPGGHKGQCFAPVCPPL